MKVLALLVSVQFALRLFSQAPSEALASTAFLMLFVVICYHWGGWATLQGAAKWFVARPLAAWLVGGGVAWVIALGVYNGGFTVASIAFEAIGAYFYFHAFCAVGDRLFARSSKP
jgi:hypothetical protein